MVDDLKIESVSIYVQFYSDYSPGDFFKGSIAPRVLLKTKAGSGARLAASNVKFDLSSCLTFGQFLFDDYFNHLKRGTFAKLLSAKVVLVDEQLAA